MRQRLYVVMGVAGCGKSSIGAGIAVELGGTYIDGDDFHPQSNIQKMESGEPLTDEDRWPWLEIVSNELARIDGIALVGCSALKKAYRDFIQSNINEPLTFIYLKGSKQLIGARMSARQGHFMPTSLLDSQFAALEEPGADENHMTIDINGSMQNVIELAVRTITQNKETDIGK